MFFRDPDMRLNIAVPLADDPPPAIHARSRASAEAAVRRFCEISIHVRVGFHTTTKCCGHSDGYYLHRQSEASTMKPMQSQTGTSGLLFAAIYSSPAGKRTFPLLADCCTSWMAGAQLEA